MSNLPHLVIVTILWERSSIICHRWKSTNMVARKCAFPNVQSIFDYQTLDYNDYKKTVLEVTETLCMKTSYNQTKTWTQKLPELTFYFKNLIIQCKGCHWSIARFKNWLCCHINLLCWIMVSLGSYELCFSMRLEKNVFWLQTWSVSGRAGQIWKAHEGIPKEQKCKSHEKQHTVHRTQKEPQTNSASCFDKHVKFWKALWTTYMNIRQVVRRYLIISEEWFYLKGQNIFAMINLQT